MKQKVMLDPTLLDEDKYDENKIEESAETLMEADEIRKDPKLMEKIQEFLDKKGKKIKNLQDLRKAAKDFSEKKDEDEEE